MEWITSLVIITASVYPKLILQYKYVDITTYTEIRHLPTNFWYLRAICIIPYLQYWSWCTYGNYQRFQPNCHFPLAQPSNKMSGMAL